MTGDNVTLKTTHGTYEGPLQDGKMHGMGKFEWNDGKTYNGQFLNGKLHGEGSLCFPNGQLIKG